jgi:hypothetical protein
MRSSGKSGGKKTNVRGRSSLKSKGSEHLTLPEPPEDLVKACISKECVLHAGSGLSAQRRLPTWMPFVSGLLDWAVKAGYIKKDFDVSLREAIHNGDTDPVADSIVSAAGTDNSSLHECLKKSFLGSSVAASKGHSLLRSNPFCAALTTNFDNLLEQTFKKEAGERICAPHVTEQLMTTLILNPREQTHGYQFKLRHAFRTAAKGLCFRSVARADVG